MYIKRPINKPRWFGLTGSGGEGGGVTPEPPPAPNGERIIYGCGLEGTSIDFRPDWYGEGVYIVSPGMSYINKLYGTVSFYDTSQRYGGTRGVFISEYYISSEFFPPDEREETHIYGRFIAEDTLKMLTDVPRIGARRKLKKGQYLICPQCVLWTSGYIPINLDSEEPNPKVFSALDPYSGIVSREYDGDDKYIKLVLDSKFNVWGGGFIEDYELLGDKPTGYVEGAIFNIRPLQYISEKGLVYVNPKNFLNYDLNTYNVETIDGNYKWNPKVCICMNRIFTDYYPEYPHIAFNLELNFPDRTKVGDTKVTLEPVLDKNSNAFTGVYKLVKGDEPISLEEAKPFIEGGSIVFKTNYPSNYDGSFGYGYSQGCYATLCFGGI